MSVGKRSDAQSEKSEEKKAKTPMIRLIALALVNAVHAESYFMTMLGGSEYNSIDPYAAVAVGGQTFKFLFDSSTSGFWLSKAECDSCPSSSASPYRPQSAPIIHLATIMEMTDGSKIHCQLFRDQIEFTDAISLVGHVCAATSVDDSLRSDMDGSVGMAPSSSTMAAAIGRLRSKLVTLYWKHPRAYGQQRIGFIGMGDIKRDFILGTPRFVKTTTSSDSWTVESMGIVVNGHSYKSKYPVIINTAESYAAFEPNTFALIVVAIGASYDSVQKKYFVDYNHIFSLPSMKLFLGGEGLVLDFHPTDLVEFAFDQHPNNMVALRCRMSQTAFNVIGNSILSNYHVVFDFDNRQIGFGAPIIAGL